MDKMLLEKTPKQEWPKTLHHYTSNIGLLGIIDNDNLWMTDIEYLNDFKEYKHFIDITNQQFEKLISKTDPHKAQIEQWLEKFYAVPQTERVYLVSFSDDGDSLPQWRAYCRPSGFCIDFDFESLVYTLEMHRSADNYNSFMLKVNYDVKHAEAAAKEIIQGMKSACEVGQLNDDDSGPLLLAKFFLEALKHKDPYFESEQEWRFVSIGIFGRNSQLLQLRPSGSGVVPYIPIKITQREDDQTLIKSIRSGPGLNHERQKAALEKYLKIHKNKEILVEKSAIPFRPEL